MTRSLILVSWLAVAMTAALAGHTPAVAQEARTSDMQILREKILADKKLLVASNMELTDEEAQRFWPVYENYQKDLGKLNGRMRKVIEDYAASYQSMTDDKARALLNESVAIEQERSGLLRDYLPKISAVLPAKKAARYYQIESKIRAVVNYELADAIPLVE